jgi:hypothetical protein
MMNDEKMPGSSFSIQHSSFIIDLLPRPRLLTRRDGTCSTAAVHTTIDSSAAPRQGYRLTIAPGGVAIVAADAAGAFYAHQTLAQIRRQFPAALPCLEIEDSPDFPVRGVMLDISRDKVPTMATLFLSSICLPNGRSISFSSTPSTPSPTAITPMSGKTPAR